MNDPNGLVFHDGLYHLFFQHNPEGLEHGNISWGHAVSQDLVTWTERPVAIAFDESEQVFSGSVVVDTTDTSGFGTSDRAPLVAVYTSAHHEGIQAQSLAYSDDGGDTWVKYTGNPVLDRNSRDFRDPKVFRYHGPQEDYWVMVAVEATEHRVLLYRSDDLRSWTFLSSYGPAGAVGGVWECPDLFPLALDGDPEKVFWVLLVSLNPGGVAGGSGTQYLIGDFDGTHFLPFETPSPVGAEDPALSALAWLDHGRDCYAGVTFNGLEDGERILIAWMSNWDYAHDVPLAPWRGAMTVPRRLSLRQVDGRPQLNSVPVLPVSGRRRAVELAHDDVTLHLPTAAVLEFAVTGDTGSVGMTIADGTGEVRVEFDLGHRTLNVDRRRAGSGVTSGLFPSVETATLPVDGPGDVVIVCDHDSIEVFAAGGLRTVTDLAYLGERRTLTVVRRGRTGLSRLTVADLSP
jgi:levanase/fructan beta-fructosidase/levanbiose-producing levanase